MHASDLARLIFAVGNLGCIVFVHPHAGPGTGAVLDCRIPHQHRGAGAAAVSDPVPPAAGLAQTLAAIYPDGPDQRSRAVL